MLTKYASKCTRGIMVMMKFLLVNILLYTLPKCPVGHQILYRGLKLDSKNSTMKYKKIKSLGTVNFSPGS